MQMVIKEGILLGTFLLLLEILRFRAAALNGDRVVVVMIVILPPRKFSKLWCIFFLLLQLGVGWVLLESRGQRCF